MDTRTIYLVYYLSDVSDTLRYNFFLTHFQVTILINGQFSRMQWTRHKREGCDSLSQIGSTLSQDRFWATIMNYGTVVGESHLCLNKGN